MQIFGPRVTTVAQNLVSLSPEQLAIKPPRTDSPTEKFTVKEIKLWAILAKMIKDSEVPLMALNHVSRLCRDVNKSTEFYTKVLGMVLIERPPAFDFDGAWLFNYGIGIHLVQSKDQDRLPNSVDHLDLDPRDNHISFQCEDMEALEQRLKEFNIKYMKRSVEDDENRTKIDQLFFNDPDGFMIEICNCENLKLVPAGSLGKIKLPLDRHSPPVELAGEDIHQK